MSEHSGYYFDVIAWRNSQKVRAMSRSARLTYFEILNEIWLCGGLPKDLHLAAKCLNLSEKYLKKIFNQIEPCLITAPHDPTQWTSERMELERAKRNEIKELRSTSGRLGGLAKASKCLANAKQTSSKSLAIQVQEQVLVQEQGGIYPPIVPLPKAPARAGTKTRCPDEMAVTDEDWNWAAREHIHIDLESETRAMIDWARSKAEHRADWVATRHNWWRNAAKRMHGGSNGQQRESETEAKIRRTREASERLLRRLDGQVSGGIQH